MKFPFPKSRIPPHADDHNKIQRIFICLFLAVVILLVYWNVQGHEFLNYDDGTYVTGNENVKTEFTIASVIWAFTTSHASNWHPVTWLSHMLDYQLYGLNPKGHHLTNVLFHIVNAILLFLVLRRMTGALWQSAFVAALFALHPLNVESVAWAAERKNVLSTFFWMASMWAYISYVEKKSVSRYGLVFLFLALGLMSKPMLVTLPFVLLMMDYWPLGRLKLAEKGENISRLIMEKVPLLALAAGSSAATFLIQKSSGAVKSGETYPLPTRIVNALVSYLEYLEKMVWPKALAVLYPHPGSALPMWKGVVCGFVIIAVSITAVRMIQRIPYLAFGWFWYLGTLVPVIGLVQVGAHAMADRYAYVPLIGIFIVIAWGLPDLLAKWRYREKVLAVSAGILIPALMALTWKQVDHWQNNYTLFKHAVEVTDTKYPNFAIAHNNFGNALREHKKLGEAIYHFREAIKLHPYHTKAHFNLGVILGQQAKYVEAVVHLKIAVKLDPDNVQVRNNLGLALAKSGMPLEAMLQYRKAIRIDPENAEAHFSMGTVLNGQRLFEGAILQFNEAIRLNPNYANAHNNLGISLGQIGKFEEAIVHFQKAVEIDFDFVEAHRNLGLALTQMGQNKEAAIHFNRAKELQEKIKGQKKTDAENLEIPPAPL